LFVIAPLVAYYIYIIHYTVCLSFFITPDGSTKTRRRKNRAVKMKNTHNYRRKIKRKKTIKSKSEYTSRPSPNGPLNIYVANMPWRNMID